MGLLGDAFKLGGSIIAGGKKKKASKKAIAAYEAAANQSIGTLTNAVNEVTPEFQDYQDVGRPSLSAIAAGIESGRFRGPDPSTIGADTSMIGADRSQIGADMSLLDPADAPDASQFQASPDYQYRVSEAMKGVEASAAARFGGVNNGATLKALLARSSGLAGQEFGNWWDRSRQSNQDRRGANVQKYDAQYRTGADRYDAEYRTNTDRYNADYRTSADRYSAGTAQGDADYRRLGDLVDLGYRATGDVSGTRLGLAGNVADTQLNIGNAKAGGIIDRGNINAQNWQNVGTFLGQGAEAIASGGLSEVGRQFGFGGGSSYGAPAMDGRSSPGFAGGSYSYGGRYSPLGLGGR